MQNSVSQCQIEKIQSNFLNLDYDANTNSIKGELDFIARYYVCNSKSKKKGRPDEYKIEFCQSSDDGCIVDCYEIEITCEQGNWAVREVGGRIERLAKKQGKELSDLHINGDKTCCLGLFHQRPNETISEFILYKTFPYFVWQAYYEVYGEIPPGGEWRHYEEGEEDFKKSLKTLGVNDKCPCGSNIKIKKCCGIEKIKEIE